MGCQLVETYTKYPMRSTTTPVLPLSSTDILVTWKICKCKY